MLFLPYDYYSPFVLDGKEFAEEFVFRFTLLAGSISRGLARYEESKKGGNRESGSDELHREMS